MVAPGCSSLHCTASPLTHTLQRITYAKSKSDAVSKQDGTFVEKKKRKPEESKYRITSIFRWYKYSQFSLIKNPEGGFIVHSSW